MLALTSALTLFAACGTPPGSTAPGAAPTASSGAPRQRWDLPGVVRTQPSQPAAKRVTPIADLLPARPDATFADSADAVVQTWVRLLDESQGVDVVAGDVAGLDLFDGERILRSRVFLFLPDRPLGDDALARLLESVSEAAPGARRAVRIHGIDGSTYHDRNGTCFLGVDDPHDTGAVIWVVSDSEDDVRAAIDAFRAAALAG